MEKYCAEHMAGKGNIWLGDVYAYTAETEHYRFSMRFDPRPGMYDCYLYAYDLDEQRRLEKEEQTPKQLSGSRSLRPEDIHLGDEITRTDSDVLNFYIENWFDVDEVFGTHVRSKEKGEDVDIYANYDMKAGKLCDKLKVMLWHDDGCEECAYLLSADEKKILLPKMDEYCRIRTGKNLAELSEKCLAEERIAPTAKNYAKKQREER